MTRKPIELEEVAFTVDTSRMLETLRRSRLSDRYAYVRDLMAAAQSRNAKTIRVRGRGRKIIFKDDGNGIPYENLDERLATIFNEGEMDDLAGGILSSFDAGASTVRIDTAPAESEAYSVTITYDGESFAISDREKTTITAGTTLTILKKKRKDGSSWWQGLKAEKKWRDKLSYLTTGGSPEVLRVRDAVATNGMGLDVIVNGQKTQRKQEQVKCLVEHQLDYHGVTGKIGFLASPDIYQKFRSSDYSGHTSSLEKRKSLITVYRKGFFQGTIDSEDLSLLVTSPFSAEVNCNTIKVDISGNSMAHDPLTRGIVSNAINDALPELMDKLLDLTPSLERDRHLLFWMNCYLGSVLHSSPSKSYLSSKNRSARDDHDTFSTKKIFSRLVKTALIPTRKGRVSLDDLLSSFSKGEPILIDHQGYGRESEEELNQFKHVVKTYDESVGDLVDEILSNTNFDGTSIAWRGQRGARRFYRLAGNEDRERRGKALEKVERFLPLVLYRPLQVTSAYYGVIRELVSEKESDYYGGANLPMKGTSETKIMRGVELAGVTLLAGITAPMYLVVLPFAAAYGACETVGKYVVMPSLRAVKPHWPAIKQKSRSGLEGLVSGSKAAAIGIGKAALTIGGGLGLVVASPVIGLYYAGRAGVRKISDGINTLQDRYSPALQDRRLANEDRRRISASNKELRKAERELQQQEHETERKRQKELSKINKKESLRDVVYRRVAEDYFKKQLDDDPHFPDRVRIYHPADKTDLNSYLNSNLDENHVFWKRSSGVAAFDAINARSAGFARTIYLNGTLRRWRRFITAIAEMRNKDRITPFVGSYLIAEAPQRGVVQVVVQYQSAFFEQKVEAFYQDATRLYQTGETDQFFAAYDRAPRSARIEIFTRVLPLERQSSIDDRLTLDADNLPLMEEAARIMVEKKK